MKIVIDATRQWDFVGGEAMNEAETSIELEDWNENYITLEVPLLEGKIFITRDEFKRIIEAFK